MTSTERVRPDRSAGIKDAIRKSARDLFTERGFDETGVRDIAAAAGVNPAIVLRHFGSKENLFLATVDAAAVLESMIDGPLEQLGNRVAQTITRGRHRGMEVFGTVVRASSRPDVRRRLQESMKTMIADRVHERLSGPDAQLRAHLFAAAFFGLMSAYAVYDDEVLLDAPLEKVAARYGAGLQLLISGQ